MAATKKSFKGAGMEAIVPTTAPAVEAEKRTRGRPRSNFKIPKSTSDAGTKPGETRASFVMSEAHLEALKAMARYRHTTIKLVLSYAIEQYLKSEGKEVGKALAAYKKHEAEIRKYYPGVKSA